MKNLFKNKTILITGGTGFLGRNLTKEILKFSPHSIRIFGRDEFKHSQVIELFNHDKRIRNFIGDVRDYERLKKAMNGCDIVIHAAALKRIDMMEYNVEESIKTNVLGTVNVVRAALENNIDRAIYVSTDKACSPINTYGACKFVSERIFIESNYSKGTARTKFVAVRYGNVLESTGSVIPLFVEKIKRNQVIPLTDERMTRFIISSKQATDLIFKAIRYGIGGEIFVPKIPAMTLPDLIEVLKEKFNSTSKVKIVGLRAGEKIHELLINGAEMPLAYDFGNIYVLAPFLEKIEPWGKAIKGNGVYTKYPISHSFKEYSSKNSIVSKEELKKILDSSMNIK